MWATYNKSIEKTNIHISRKDIAYADPLYKSLDLFIYAMLNLILEII